MYHPGHSLPSSSSSGYGRSNRSSRTSPWARTTMMTNRSLSPTTTTTSFPLQRHQLKQPKEEEEQEDIHNSNNSTSGNVVVVDGILKPPTRTPMKDHSSSSTVPRRPIRRRSNISRVNSSVSSQNNNRSSNNNYNNSSSGLRRTSSKRVVTPSLSSPSSPYNNNDDGDDPFHVVSDSFSSSNKNNNRQQQHNIIDSEIGTVKTTTSPRHWDEFLDGDGQWTVGDDVGDGTGWGRKSFGTSDDNNGSSNGNGFYSRGENSHSHNNHGQSDDNPKVTRRQEEEEKKDNHDDGFIVTKNTDNTTTETADHNVDDDDEHDSWRKYGKKFRANLVLHDEEQDGGNGGNSFVLSNACSIERYYRVAGRVLDQFVNSDVAQPTQMNETFLVGHRLFKFLSVVLPTHKDYFSTEPDLVAMRIQSQGQLVELLEYMEELELMIDEMEYNKYIINDLGKPKRVEWYPHDETASTVNDTMLSSIGPDGSMLDQNPIDEDSVATENPKSLVSSAIAAVAPPGRSPMTKLPATPNPKRETVVPSHQFLQVRYNMGVRAVSSNIHHFNSLRSQRSVASNSNDSIEATSQVTEGSSSQRSTSSRRLSRKEERFEQKVAAVVNATSNKSPAAIDFNHRNGRRPSSSSLRQSRTSFHSERQLSSPNPDSRGEMFDGWSGVDPSWANFSLDGSQVESAGTPFERQRSRIDLLAAEDNYPTSSNQNSQSRSDPSSTTATPAARAAAAAVVPKIKQPREALPRNVRAVHAAQYSSAMECTMDDSGSAGPSFMSVGSSDVFYSLDDESVKESNVLQTRIGRRFDGASLVNDSTSESIFSKDIRQQQQQQRQRSRNYRQSQDDFDMDRPRRCFKGPSAFGGGGSTNNSQYSMGKGRYQEDDSLLMDGPYHSSSSSRPVGYHFRGCVRSLIS